MKGSGSGRRGQRCSRQKLRLIRASKDYATERLERHRLAYPTGWPWCSSTELALCVSGSGAGTLRTDGTAHHSNRQSSASRPVKRDQIWVLPSNGMPT
jgi:hypothetical protein